MKTYVISDIHGQYTAFEKMLRRIHFGAEDVMYVLGDVIDRGPDGIHIIEDIMRRDNISLILGNHELMLLNAVAYLEKKEAGEDPFADSDAMNPLELWTHPCNGGEGTCLEYSSMSAERKTALISFLRDCALIRRLKVDGKRFHLSHSYSMDRPFSKDEVKLKDVSVKRAEMIVWDSLFDPQFAHHEGEKLLPYKRDNYIVGHIFTQRIGHMDEDGKGIIFHSDDFRGYNVTDIDCGMALNSRSSQLACLCLDTGEEFYIPLLDDRR
ncbi:MAG: fructose-bisphosphatase class III [Lachnospiraceae bacterium]|nr:fructose-bisphosphatase class III [Lachnospiraceae bacterium]